MCFSRSSNSIGDSVEICALESSDQLKPAQTKYGLLKAQTKLRPSMGAWKLRQGSDLVLALESSDHIEHEDWAMPWKHDSFDNKRLHVQIPTEYKDLVEDVRRSSVADVGLPSSEIGLCGSTCAFWSEPAVDRAR